MHVTHDLWGLCPEVKEVWKRLRPLAGGDDLREVSGPPCWAAPPPVALPEALSGSGGSLHLEARCLWALRGVCTTQEMWSQAVAAPGQGASPLASEVGSYSCCPLCLAAAETLP